MKSAGNPTEEAHLLTGDVLIEEYQVIHGEDLKQKYEQDTGSEWSRFPTAALDYDAKWGSGQWNALTSEEQEKECEEQKKEWDKARQLYYFQHVHGLKPNDKVPGQTALCLSGGGIRSAAFALGLMQGLARHRLLSQFHYLSTVSGGGYVGAWLTAWATRAAAAVPTPKQSQSGDRRMASHLTRLTKLRPHSQDPEKRQSL